MPPPPRLFPDVIFKDQLSVLHFRNLGTLSLITNFWVSTKLGVTNKKTKRRKEEEEEEKEEEEEEENSNDG